MKRILLTFALLVTAMSASAIDVRGIKVGGAMTESRLVKMFGQANCDDKISIPLNEAITCIVPMSYLGFNTEAYVGLYHGT
jgi:hypothetical protein